MSERSERNDQLKGLIQNGQIDRAIEMIRSVRDYHEGELFVSTVLREEKSMPELVEAVLEAYLGMRENRYLQHGNWVHSLSHFIGILWERRMDGWIKKFNQVSFKGANELDDSGCSDRLVDDFGRYAEFDDDPADFSLTPENLRWMNWKYFAYSKARIEAGRFESEEAFLRWKLHRPETHIAFDYETQTNLVNLDGIRSLVQQLQELGADTSEFNGLERDLLTKQLSKLEAKRPAATLAWQRERLEKGIQKTRAALASR